MTNITLSALKQGSAEITVTSTADPTVTARIPAVISPADQATPVKLTDGMWSLPGDGGAGFLNDAGKKHAYPDQVTTAIGKTQGKTVRRVFLVGLSNDQARIKSGGMDAEINAMTKTATMIKSAWPGAQLIYIVEVAPQTKQSKDLVSSFGSVINQVYTLFEREGFNVARGWFDWMPDGKTNGYLYDSMHPNAKGMNVAAHKIREWVNTLSGPKINGEIPAWSE